MVRCLEALTDLGEESIIERELAAGARDVGRCFLRNQIDLGLALGERGEDAEPGASARLVVEERTCFRRTPGAAIDEGVRNMARHD